MPTVLLVDDSAVALHALARRLKAEGFDVRAESTIAGASTVDAADLTCAAIDIDLPDGSGVDLAGDLLAARPALPIAFFTAGVSAAAVTLARRRGPVFYKPDLDALVAWLKSSAQPPPTK
jgi:DNA-binding response OmpR family regulator